MKDQSKPKDEERIDIARRLRQLADQVEAGDVEAYKMAMKLFSKRKRGKQKIVAPIDAFKILREEGEDGLRKTLDSLGLTELKAVLLAYDLDRQRLARKWKNKERLKEYIFERLVAQFKSGRVFLK